MQSWRRPPRAPVSRMIVSERDAHGPEEHESGCWCAAAKGMVHSCYAARCRFQTRAMDLGK